jgi:hypothetical protein
MHFFSSLETTQLNNKLKALVCHCEIFMNFKEAFGKSMFCANGNQPEFMFTSMMREIKNGL